MCGSLGGVAFQSFLQSAKLQKTVKTNPILEERKVQESDCLQFLIQVHQAPKCSDENG